MAYSIVAYGDPVLRAQTQEIEKEGDIDVKQLSEEMFETMHNASGVGLAAPQIGKSIRMFIVDAAPMEDIKYPDFKKTFINPEILEESGEEWDFEEGCLSIPGIREDVTRYEKLTIRYFDVDWKEHIESYEGIAARIIQHEFDHLEGVLFTDYLNGFKKRLLKGKLSSISRGDVKVDYRMRFPKKKKWYSSMQDLSITLIQSDIHWHKIDANLAAFEEKIWSTEKSDIILLPEMFNTGFSMDASSMAERMNGKTFKWLRNMASQSGSYIMGSFLVYENSNYYNRLICMEPGGDYSYYDKRHLFRMTGEDKVFSPGNKINIHEIKGWKINTLICYDLRFPVWSRNSYDPDNDSFLYDMIIYVANWPAARISAWDILLKARAVENICFSVGLNRIGTDGVGIDYNGHSNISGPKGDFLEEPREDGFIKRYILSADELTLIRNKFPAHLDFDSYQIKM